MEQKLDWLGRVQLVASVMSKANAQTMLGEVSEPNRLNMDSEMTLADFFTDKRNRTIILVDPGLQRKICQIIAPKINGVGENAVLDVLNGILAHPVETSDQDEATDGKGWLSPEDAKVLRAELAKKDDQIKRLARERDASNHDYKSLSDCVSEIAIRLFMSIGKPVICLVPKSADNKNDELVSEQTTGESGEEPEPLDISSASSAEQTPS